MGKMTRQFVRAAWQFGLLLMAFQIDGQAQTLPDGPGKDAVQQACTQCHGLNSVAVARHTKQEWENVVTDMIGRGATLTESEIGVIADYLARSFPKTNNNINVNRASSKELVDLLRLTNQEAEALLRHREENGYFNKFEDLQRVAGLDIKKLEPARNRLQY